MRPHSMISFCVMQGDGTYNFTNKKFKGWIVCVTIDHFTANMAFFVDGVKIPDEVHGQAYMTLMAAFQSDEWELKNPPQETK